MKQAERDAIQRVLDDYPEGKIPVNQFAKDVEGELLPLDRKSGQTTGYPAGSQNLRYENVNLPAEQRGNVANYDEHIYQSPVKTSAGGVHFGDSTDNYFAHTRVEDLGPSASGVDDGTGKFFKGDTRRVIELQSDLFQKGRLDQEVKQKMSPYDIDDPKFSQLRGEADSEISKLKPYENTWHERVIREEVKKAAQDGKTKLQFPTGETAMKIEGLGQNTNNFHIQDTRPIEDIPAPAGAMRKLEVADLKPGASVEQFGNEYIITDVLGDGKFKAIPKEQIDLTIENDHDMYQEAIRTGIMDKETAEINHAALQKSPLYKKILKEIPDMHEQFDISGKVDQSNPIYRFYESEVGKYLGKKYDAKRIKDPQGVEWYEINVKPEAAKKPIEAYGMLPPIIAGSGLMPASQDQQ